MTESVMSDNVQTHGGNGAEQRKPAAETQTPGGRLIGAEQARDYQGRWDSLKGDFVDNPKDTLAQVDGLVGEVLEELERTFRRQRDDLESGVSGDGASTEDLRLAFGRYREFFDRLLAI